MTDRMARREQQRMPASRSQMVSPYQAMRDMMESTMEDFFSDWPGMRISPFEWRMQRFSPSIDVIDEEKQIRVEAEVPGVTPEDLEITVTRDSMILKGEKKLEREEERQGVCYSERSFGSFQRIIPFREDVETDRIEAHFRNGVLEIVVPKSEQSIRLAKKIQIKAEEQQQPPQGKGEQEIQSSGAEEGIKQKG